MELKKNPKADLEKRKGLYFEIGLVVILAACLVAFSWPSYDDGEKKVSNQDQETEVVEEEEMENTEIEEETPPPPPPPEVEEEVNMEEIIIKEDDEQLEHQVEVVDFDEATNTTQIAEVQIEEDDEVDEEIVKVPDKDPEFPGGMDALYKYLADNIKFPKVAQENGISGKVYVTFVVEKDGRITDVRVLRDIGGGCGAEAVRVVKSMPKWSPGKMGARAVRVQFNLPVNFTFKN